MSRSTLERPTANMIDMVTTDSHLVTRILFLAIAYWVISSIYHVVYNLYFHPLSHVPGPRLAAATYLYQTYHGFVGGSKYYIRIAEMHEIYGPVVRITPDEVHLSDPSNYEKIYFVGSKYPKSKFYDCFGIPHSTFATKEHDMHRMRRSALNPFFSRKMVLQLENLVQDKVSKLCEIASRSFKEGKKLDLHHAFRAISIDVATDYAFADCYNFLDREDLGVKFFELVQERGPMMWFFMQWPGLLTVAMGLPKWLASRMAAHIAQTLAVAEHARKQCQDVKDAMDAGQFAERPTIFQALLDPEGNHEDYIVPTVDQLKDEASSTLIAAADTTGNALTAAAYHVMTNPTIWGTLKKELEKAYPDPNTELRFMELEKLPYLTAVIKEGLRLSFGVTGRLAREVPSPGATFNDITIPACCNVSMSTWTMHHNTEYFPNPDKFDPNRWMDPKESRRLDKAFVPFSKGTRGCVGMPLAWCELYLTIGTFFRRFENIKCNELREEDLELEDYFASYHPLSARKLTVTKI